MTTQSVPPFPLSRQFGAGDLVDGRYRLVRQIGAGAMGAVWVAHNMVLDIDVAVKVLRVDNQKADARRLYKRLLREAQAAARLGHPGIVRVFDFGQMADNSPYIAMELLSGESLAELLAKKPRMEVIPAVQLLLPIIDAMATAHGRGIIHRDLKPENIFLARDEYGRVTPKIVDFGVARFIEAGRSLTRSGALLGTPDYMAPEQARGEPGIDQRVDIWSVCIVLYELVVGRRPFARHATNYLAVLRAIIHELAPSTLSFGVGDDALWRIIERGLKKRKQERWETMRSLGQALALWLYERGVREDFVGASLKTTWLQAGLDGVKIETPSIPPPKADELSPVSSSDHPPEPSVRPAPPRLRRRAAAKADAMETVVESGAPALVKSPPRRPPSVVAEWRHRLGTAAILLTVAGGLAATVFVVRQETKSYRGTLSPETTQVVHASLGAAPPPLPVAIAPAATTAELSPASVPAEPPPAPAADTSVKPEAGASTATPPVRAASVKTTTTRRQRSAPLPPKTYNFGF